MVEQKRDGKMRAKRHANNVHMQHNRNEKKRKEIKTVIGYVALCALRIIQTAAN